jgi:hypothetical protein
MAEKISTHSGFRTPFKALLCYGHHFRFLFAMDTISALVSISGFYLLWTHSGFHQMAMKWIGRGSVGGAVAAAVGGSVALLWLGGSSSLWLGGVAVARRRCGDGGMTNDGTVVAALCGTMVRMILEACL